MFVLSFVGRKKMVTKTNENELFVRYSAHCSIGEMFFLSCRFNKIYSFCRIIIYLLHVKEAIETLDLHQICALK